MMMLLERLGHFGARVVHRQAGTVAMTVQRAVGESTETIAVIARELERHCPADETSPEAVALLRTESARCQDILARIATRPAPFIAARRR